MTAPDPADERFDGPTDWTLDPVDRYSLGMLVTAEEADALADIGETVDEWQIGGPS